MDATEQHSDDYIERLFPRCSPPKPRQGQQRNNITRGRMYQHTRRERASMSQRRLKHHINNNNNSSDSSENENNRKDMRSNAIPTSLSHHSALNNDDSNNLHSRHQPTVTTLSSTTSLNNSRPVRAGGEILLASGKYNSVHQRNNYSKGPERSASYIRRRYAHKRNHPIKHNNNDAQYTTASNNSNTTSSTTNLNSNDQVQNFDVKQQQRGCNSLDNNNQSSYNSYETDLVTSNITQSQTESTLNSTIYTQQQQNQQNMPIKIQAIHSSHNDLSSRKHTTASVVIKSHPSELDHSISASTSNSALEPHVASYNYTDGRSSTTNNLMINDSSTNDSTSTMLPQDATSYEYDVKCSSDINSSTNTLEKYSNNISSSNNETGSPRDKYLHIFVYDDAKNSEEPIKLAVNRHDDSNDTIQSPTRGSSSFMRSSSTAKELYDPNPIMGSALSPVTTTVTTATTNPPTSAASLQAQVECPSTHQTVVSNTKITENLEVADNTIQYPKSHQHHSERISNRTSGGSTLVVLSPALSQQDSNKSDHRQRNLSLATSGESTANKSTSPRSVAPGYPQRVITLQKSDVTRLSITPTTPSNEPDPSRDARLNLTNYSSQPSVDGDQINIGRDADRLSDLSPPSTLQSQTMNLITRPDQADDTNDDNNDRDLSRYMITATNNVYSITDLLHLSSLKDSEFDDASRDELNHQDVSVNDKLSMHDDGQHQGDNDSATTLSSNSNDTSNKMDVFMNHQPEKYVSSSDSQTSSSNLISSYPTSHQVDAAPRYHFVEQITKEVTNRIIEVGEGFPSNEHKTTPTYSATPIRRLPSIVEEEKPIQHQKNEDIEQVQLTPLAVVSRNVSDHTTSLLGTSAIATIHDTQRSNETTQQQQMDLSSNQCSTNIEPSSVNQQQPQHISNAGNLVTKNSLILLHERVHGYVAPSSHRVASTGSSGTHLEGSATSSNVSISSLRNKHLPGLGSNVESYKGPPLLSHFHCLSDIESGPEETETVPSTETNIISQQHQMIVPSYHAGSGVVSSDDNTNNNIPNNNENPISSSNGGSSVRQAQSTISQAFLNNGLSQNIHQDHQLLNHVDDEDEDIHEKMTTSALMFPRLDEGLSSGAESADDEPYDDDECADDADNDDDDDDDNDVDDTDLDQPSLHNLANRQDNIAMTTKLQNQEISIKRKTPHRSLSIASNHNTNNSNSILDGPMNPILRGTSGSFNGGMPNDGLTNMMKSNSYIMTSQAIHRNDLDGNEHPSSSALTKQSDMKQPLGNFDQGLALQSNNNDQQLNHWSSQQQPSTSQQPDHRENNGYSINKITSQSEVKTSQFSSDTDNETDRLLGTQRNDQLKLSNNHVLNDSQHQLSEKNKANTNTREVLIEGVLFIVKYLGSTQLECDGQSSKQARVNQAEMAVYEVKAPDGEPQPHTEVQLFISTEKIMVLDQKHRKIMMDHSLRTISYIADIGEILVLMARRRNLSNDLNDSKTRRVAKMICHVFESEEAQLIAQSMNHAFQLAYMEFLKASGIEETGFLSKEMDYQEVLNSQEMSTDELEMFANRKNQREVIVPKQKGEILGISIVESGWGSMLPTVVIANLKPDGPAYRCKKLAIGDQILSINGNSLVGLPLADCQEHIRKTKNQTVAKLSIVPCPITVEVKIRRPDTKYQLGFSVQNGVICSLLRGGIAERGGVRVGHRIMSINGTTVVGVPHEKIVTLLASSVGEIRMKTCLTSLYRLMLGQEHPVHF